MKYSKARLLRLALLGATLAGFLPLAGNTAEPRGATGTKQSSFLYTAPDPAAEGGLHGRVIRPAKPLLNVFAQASDDWKRVYRGTLNAEKNEFRFSGLPVGLYDLVILYDDCFYEGLSLMRDENTLTDKDLESIKGAIMKSTPFFNEKKIHRCEGTTGYAGTARCLLPEDVGMGWSVVNTREFVRQEVAATDVKGLLPHHFVAELGNIRVIEKIKELGDLSLP
jgi:hypothetical protein